MLERPGYTAHLFAELEVHDSAALLGPRQCGKTTLGKQILEKSGGGTFFDLERASDRRRLESPELALRGLSGLVVLDEIQRMPGLFETLRVLLDDSDNRAKYLLLGSASPSLVRGVSESLAGRVGMVDLGGFQLSETGRDAWHRLWVRGGFPRSFLADTEDGSVRWRESFVRTFLERDIPQLGISIPSETLRRFWTMVAHWHGQVWNAAEFARALGTSEATARRYLDILSGAYMVRLLPPWYENLKKRQVKSPKVYIRDTGLLHSLLELPSGGDVTGHPKVGASWEGFVAEHLIAAFGTRSATFWATHAGAKLDLMITVRGRRHGFECKWSDAPKTTRSMRVALEDLRLEHLWIIYPGQEPYQLDTKISALPAAAIPTLPNELGDKGLQ